MWVPPIAEWTASDNRFIMSPMRSLVKSGEQPLGAKSGGVVRFVLDHQRLFFNRRSEEGAPHEEVVESCVQRDDNSGLASCRKAIQEIPMVQFGPVGPGMMRG